jgi:hypothetical protein
VWTNVLLAGAAVVRAAGTYYAVENPVRHWTLLTRFPLASVAGGLGLIGAGLVVVTVAI